MVPRLTANGKEWHWMTTSGTMNDNEWYNEWQQVTKSDNKRQRVTTSDSKWQWVTPNNSKWYNERERHSTLQRMDDCHKTQKQIH